jgi:hypothetical protein
VTSADDRTLHPVRYVRYVHQEQRWMRKLTTLTVCLLPLLVFTTNRIQSNMFLSSIVSKSALYRSSTSFRSFSTSEKVWKVYLSGEIHSDWREVIAKGISEKNLPVSITSPNTSHEDSDDCGAIVLGMQEKRPNWDKIGTSFKAFVLLFCLSL